MMGMGATEDGAWKVYKRRWYMLLVFSMLAFQQSLLWITFSPIADSTKEYYRTTDFVVNLLLAWGPIMFIPFVFVTAWLMNRKGGLRTVVLLGAVLGCIGAGIRCFSVFPSIRHTGWAIAILSMGQILNAMVGPLIGASPSKLSATWFGDKERTTATAIGNLANWVGQALGFVIGPYVVDAWSLPVYLYIEAAFAFLVMVWILAYFPDKPPTPPSASAHAAVSAENNQESNPNQRSQLEITARELIGLLQHPSFMILAFISGWASGAFSSWSGMFDIILGPEGYSQELAGWMGFASTTAGIAGGLVLGILGDTIFRRKFKLLLITLFIFGTGLFLVFSLSLPSIFGHESIISIHKEWFIILSVTLGGLFIGSTTPIFMELGAELAFPISEGSSASIVTLMLNIAGLIVLFVSPYFPRTWINCLVTFSLGFCTLLFALVKEEYKRSNFDTMSYQPIQDVS